MALNTVCVCDPKLPSIKARFSVAIHFIIGVL